MGARRWNRRAHARPVIPHGMCLQGAPHELGHGEVRRGQRVFSAPAPGAALEEERMPSNTIAFPRMVKVLGVVCMLAVLTLAGCGGGGSGTTGGSNKPGTGVKVIVGSKNDPDGQLLGWMY